MLVIYKDKSGVMPPDKSWIVFDNTSRRQLFGPATQEACKLFFIEKANNGRNPGLRDKKQNRPA